MRRPVPTAFPWGRPRHELVLLALVAVAAFSPLYAPGDQDLSRFCLTQSLVHGHLSNDRCLAPSFDKALYGGHLYSDKAPGLSFAAVPAAEALRLRPLEQVTGPDARLWGVRLLTVGVAFLLCAFLVGRVVEGLAPGRGSAALAVFGLGTIALPLAATGLAHDFAAALGFGAFVLAWRNRPLLAGLAAGACVLSEYQTAAVAALVGAYVALRGLRPLAAYAAGLVPGAAALLVYDALAFGSPFHLSYRYVALQQQQTGFFGIGAPKLHSTWEVFGGQSGLLVLSPVLAAAAAGLVLLARTRPLEAALCGAVTVFFLLLVCGYYVPYGGTELGPRFFVPALPFLAVGLGPAFARLPRVTALLGVCSALPVLAMTLIWARHPPIRGTIWSELSRLVTEGRASGLMRHLTGFALGWAGPSPGWGLALMVAAAAAALVLALPAGGLDVRARPRVAVVSAAIVLALAGGALRVATQPIQLHTTILGTATAAFPGDEVDFAVSVANPTAEFLPHASLMIQLPPGLALLGRPTFERGKGCTGDTLLDCDLDFLDSHMETTVHLGVRVEPDAGARVAVRAWGVTADIAGPKASYAVITGSG